MTIAIK